MQGHNEESCWRLHPELFVEPDREKPATDARGNAQNSQNNPIMILSSGKVIGNLGEQWKEVRDNRVKNGAKQAEIRGQTGKEIVPVDPQNVQQNGGNAGK